VACLWQAFPDKSESYIRHLVMKVSDRFTTPNNTHGYGMPNFCMAYNLTLGTDEFENEYTSDYKVYPNPTNGKFSVRVKQNSLPYDVELFDITGKKIGGLSNINNFVYTNNQLQELPSGSYFISIKTNKGIKQSIITKQ
jgi:hypothetical protein